MAKIKNIKKNNFLKQHFRLLGRDTRLAKKIAKKYNIKRPHNDVIYMVLEREMSKKITWLPYFMRSFFIFILDIYIYNNIVRL